MQRSCGIKIRRNPSQVKWKEKCGASMGVKMDDKLGTKVVEKYGFNVDVNRDEKLGINNDATLCSNDESKHGVDMVEK